MSEIIKAEEGPKRADRELSYIRANCQDCGMEIYFFRMEKYSNCHQCGAWTEKPKNGEVITF